MKDYIHIRECSQCGSGMDDGYYDENDFTYYCTKKCLHDKYLTQDDSKWSITQSAIDLRDNIFKYETVFYTEWYEYDRLEN